MKHYNSLPFNSPMLNSSLSFNSLSHDQDLDALDQNIIDVLDVERIGLPIDEDPFELIQMLRSLSDNFNKSKIEITKLRNSRDAM